MNEEEEEMSKSVKMVLFNLESEWERDRERGAALYGGVAAANEWGNWKSRQVSSA